MKPLSRDLIRNLKIASAVGLLLNALIFFYLISPWAPSRSATEARLSSATQELRVLRAEVGDLDVLQSRLRISSEQMNRLLATGMPREQVASTVTLENLNRLATASGVEIVGMSFKPDKKVTGGLRRVAIEARLEGNYGNIVAFLNQIERADQFFLIDQVSAVGSREAGQPGIRVDVGLEAWVQSSSPDTDDRGVPLSSLHQGAKS